MFLLPQLKILVIKMSSKYKSDLNLVHHLVAENDYVKILKWII